ncbi:MAG: hypothetical protein WCI72_06900 [archaeon]
MVKKIVKRSSNQRHWGVSILSVLGYIGAVFTLLLGLLFIAGSAVVGTLITQLAPEYVWLTTVGVVGLIFLGLVIIGFAVLDFFIARGLWKGQSWARIVVLVLLAISALMALTSMEIASVVIDAALIWYLGFYEPVVNYFK